MSLQTYTFDQFVAAFVNTVQQNAPQLTDSDPGSILRAFAEAIASNDLSLQNQTIHVNNVTRLATSAGADVDSYVGDFGVTRNPAKSSVGTVNLTRNLVGAQLFIPLVNNPVLQTTVGGVQYALIPDTNQASWDAINNQYFFNIGQPTIAVTVQAIVPGSAGNVLAGTITKIVAGIAGVTTVTNPTNFTSGVDAESDVALKTRFVLYLAGLANATKVAIGAKILGVQAGVSYQLIEYQHYDGNPFVAGFTAVVDDGTGSGAKPFLDACTAAIDSVRAAGIQREVRAPSNIPINVVCQGVTAAAGTPLSVLQANMTASINKFIVGLGVGVPLVFAKLANLIDTYPGLFSITSVTINGSTVDIAVLNTQLARPGTVTYS